jgi:hypothetical protein
LQRTNGRYVRLFHAELRDAFYRVFY